MRRTYPAKCVVKKILYDLVLQNDVENINMKSTVMRHTRPQILDRLARLAGMVPVRDHL